jgi:hypothetical protein
MIDDCGGGVVWEVLFNVLPFWQKKIHTIYTACVKSITSQVQYTKSILHDSIALTSLANGALSLLILPTYELSLMGD